MTYFYWTTSDPLSRLLSESLKGGSNRTQPASRLEMVGEPTLYLHAISCNSQKNKPHARAKGLNVVGRKRHNQTQLRAPSRTVQFGSVPAGLRKLGVTVGGRKPAAATGLTPVTKWYVATRADRPGRNSFGLLFHSLERTPNASASGGVTL